MPLFDKADLDRRWFVTGGAGFIGSYVVDLLVSAGCQVTVYDNLCTSTDQYLIDYIAQGKVKFLKKDLLEREALTKAMAGHDIVWHLAANTDIPSGFTKRRLDLDNGVIATCNVLEAMLENNISDILYPSSGAIYGEAIDGLFSETSGPLLPLSLYGAGKLASEGFIAAYCSLFKIRAWVYRFGNVIGARTNHGIIYDFIGKLQKNQQQLEILGTGRGEKNYFLVEECISGMLFTKQQLPVGPFPVLINLGTDSTTTIMNIAQIIIDELGLQDVKFSFTGTARGWPGDQPVVLLDTTKIQQLGWRTQHSSNQAVRVATRRMLKKESFACTVAALEQLTRQPAT